ncbi:MAG: hypothetical protein Kow0099_38780 [Candidatus Abyssubacteria bacterium]
MRFKGSKKRILIADNNGDFLSVTRSLLELAGFNAEIAKDGEEALGLIKKLKYDLLVLGVLMPRITGIRLLQKVRKSKSYASVPVLFITGRSGRRGLDTRSRGRVSRAEGYMKKPFNNRVFLETVTALLEENGVGSQA